MQTRSTDQAAGPPAASPSARERRRQGAIRAMRNRWGPQRVVRLDSLTAAEREAVVALIEVMRTGHTPAQQKAATGGLESPGSGHGRGRDRDATPAD